MTLQKKRKTEKSRVGVAKKKKNSASAIDVLIPPDTKAIIEEIPDLFLDRNLNESPSDKFDSNLNSSTELKPNFSRKEIDLSKIGQTCQWSTRSIAGTKVKL